MSGKIFGIAIRSIVLRSSGLLDDESLQKARIIAVHNGLYALALANSTAYFIADVNQRRIVGRLDRGERIEREELEAILSGQTAEQRASGRDYPSYGVARP